MENKISQENINNSKKKDTYIIVCDESTKDGLFYSYFLGGAIVKEQDYEYINEELYRLKHMLVLKELKRTYIDASNADKYIKVLNLFFNFVCEGKIKVRVMFCNNNYLHHNHEKKEAATFNKFYYFFLRYSFALNYSPSDINLRIMFDELPDKKSVNDDFKQHLIENLNIKARFSTEHSVSLNLENIHEVDSRKHLVLQCVDVIVGILDYFCNSYISESYISSKKEMGRYMVMKYIFSFINEQNPLFEILETTPQLLSKKGWNLKYAHYLYKPYKFIKPRFKKSDYNYIKKMNPLLPTSTNQDQLSPSEHKEF